MSTLLSLIVVISKSDGASRFSQNDRKFFYCHGKCFVKETFMHLLGLRSNVIARTKNWHPEQAVLLNFLHTLIKNEKQALHVCFSFFYISQSLLMNGCNQYHSIFHIVPGLETNGSQLATD